MAITTGFNPYSMVAKSSQQVAFRGSTIEDRIDTLIQDKTEITPAEAKQLIPNHVSALKALYCLQGQNVLNRLANSVSEGMSDANRTMARSLGNLLIAIAETQNGNTKGLKQG